MKGNGCSHRLAARGLLERKASGTNMAFIAHQLYPGMAGADPLQGLVRKRHVFYIQGFFPKGPAYYHKLLQQELQAFSALHDLDWSCSSLEWITTIKARCEIQVARGTETVTTVYEFLHWQDLILTTCSLGLCESLRKNILSLLAHITAGAPIHMLRTHWKYFIAWTLPYFLYLAIALCALAAVFYFSQLIFVGLSTRPLFLAPFFLIMTLSLWRISRLCWSSLMLRNFICAADYARGALPELEERIERFGQHIFSTCKESDADEILIIGHSFGTQLAVLTTAYALALGAFQNNNGRTKLLNLGDATCHIGFLKGAGALRLRHAVLKLASHPDLPWVVLYSGKDVLCFDNADPATTLAKIETGQEPPVDRFSWPLMYDAAFRSAVEKKDYLRLRWQFFRMHSQFIFAARKKTARFDYFRTICGAAPLALWGKRLTAQKRNEMKLSYIEKRQARHRAATTRWAQPLASNVLKIRAWGSLLLADHGILRPVYWNSAKVTDQIWRGPQPNPLHLRRLAKKGLKTIVNLRGPTVYGSYALAKNAAQKYGLKFIDLPIYSGSAPLKEHIHALHDLFQTIEKPALLHCKSGADRSGLAAVLYLVLSEDMPVADALKHLSYRYGHIKNSKTGILDAFFAQYINDTKSKPMRFLQWVDEVYDPDALNAAFKRLDLRRMLIDVVIRRE